MKVRVDEGTLTDGSKVYSVTLSKGWAFFNLDALDSAHAEALAAGLVDLVNTHSCEYATRGD